MLGARQFQEDRYTVAKAGTLSADKLLACFAVFDGQRVFSRFAARVNHSDGLSSGGSEVAEHARQNLVSRIDRRLKICDDYEQAISDALIEEDNAIRKTGMLQPGSTVALALVDIKRGTVIVADLGDSHVVLAEKGSEKKGDWKAKCLTEAQKPWSKGERERIHEAGGKLNRIYGEQRLGKSSVIAVATSKTKFYIQVP